MRRIVVMAVSFLLMSIFSCSPKAVQVEKPSPVEERTKASVGQSWQSNWESTLQEAKKEGKVLVYGAPNIGIAVRQSVGTFKQKYGIDVSVVSGGGGEMASKIFRERENGLFILDVFLMGLNTTFSIKNRIAEPLEPALILPEVIDPKFWMGANLPWADKDRSVLTFWAYATHMINTNTQLVKTDEMKSYYELLDPKWKGKIVMNTPAAAGPGFNGFSSLLVNKVVDLDFFQQLVRQEPVVLRDDRLIADWLARGRYAIALWGRNVPMDEYRQAGAPIGYAAPKEGTYVSASGGNLVLVNKAPHPNAAKIFINWLLGKEGQTLVQNASGTQSAREDISTEGLIPSTIRTPTGKYFIAANSVEEWVLKEQDKYLDMAKQVFSPVLQ